MSCNLQENLVHEGCGQRLWIQTAWMSNPAQPLVSSTALGTFLLLSVPQFPHLGDGLNSSIHFMCLLWWLQESMHLMHAAWCLMCDKHWTRGWYWCYHPYTLDEETKAQRERPRASMHGWLWKSRYSTHRYPDFKVYIVNNQLWFPFRVSESVICGEWYWNPPESLLKIQSLRLPENKYHKLFRVKTRNMHFSKFPRWLLNTM